MNDTKYNLRKWGNILKGEPVFLIGNAPSLNNQNLGLLEGCFTIGMNRCFRIYDPTILLWQDRGMYKNDGIEEIRNSKSIKICRDIVNDKSEFNAFKLERGEYSFNATPNRLKGHGCTGAISAQFAVAMGAGCLVLLGCDGKYGKTTDFYGDNLQHKSHTLMNFRKAYKFIKEECPIDVISCSESEYWESRELEDVVRELKIKKKTRIQRAASFLDTELK